MTSSATRSALSKVKRPNLSHRTVLASSSYASDSLSIEITRRVTCHACATCVMGDRYMSRPRYMSRARFAYVVHRRCTGAPVRMRHTLHAPHAIEHCHGLKCE
jgi:hypothetical protein